MKEKDISDNEAGILSSSSSVIVPLKQEPPNGGTTAWLQVLGAFFMYFNTWGKALMLRLWEKYTYSPLLQALFPVTELTKSSTKIRFSVIL